MELTPVAKGFASYLPGLYKWREKRRGKDTIDAEYCYQRWLGHLILLSKGRKFEIPDTVAELGPGASLGVGLAAVLSGANCYYALDLVKYSEAESNSKLLGDLVRLYRNKHPVDMSWLSESLGISMSKVEPFPRHLLSDQLMERTLSDQRVEQIRRALVAPNGRSGPIAIEYVVPWSDPRVIRPSTVDLIVSSSVLEHIDDLEGAYGACAIWLRDGGFMSHAVDFRSHALTREWNGHWQYSDRIWRLIVGNKPYLINREPYSRHIRLMSESGFDVSVAMKESALGLSRENLSPRFARLSDDDLTCSAAVLHAQRLGSQILSEE